MKHTIFALLLSVCLASCAMAQYASDFEALNASAAGVVVTGQDGYYLPNATSVDCLAYTYAGNAIGVPANPNGGDQFIAGTGPGDGSGFFARAQRDVSYAASDVWTISYDACVTFLGQLPTAQNIGSVSTQDSPVTASMILLARWTDPDNQADTWNADMVWYNEIGESITEAIPDAGFQNLDVNHWYRWSGTFDLLNNTVVEISIMDLTTGETATYNPDDRYLNGGAAGGFPPPTAFRFFVGSNTAPGNTIAFDNISIAVPSKDCVLGDVNTDGNVDLLDVTPFVNLLTAGGYQCEADINEDGAVDLLDVAPFVDLLSGG